VFCVSLNTVLTFNSPTFSTWPVPSAACFDSYVDSSSRLGTQFVTRKQPTLLYCAGNCRYLDSFFWLCGHRVSLNLVQLPLAISVYHHNTVLAMRYWNTRQNIQTRCLPQNTDDVSAVSVHIADCCTQQLASRNAWPLMHGDALPCVSAMQYTAFQGKRGVQTARNVSLIWTGRTLLAVHRT